MSLLTTFFLCCGILNAIVSSQDHYRRECISRIAAEADDSDGDDLFKGLDGDAEDVDLTEFSKP